MPAISSSLYLRYLSHLFSERYAAGDNAYTELYKKKYKNYENTYEEERKAGFYTKQPN